MRILITGGSGFIGTNIVNYYNEKKIDVMSIDIAPPRNKDHMPFWKQVDILKLGALTECLHEFSPTHMIHLASRTDLNGKHINEYIANTVGTENVIKAINSYGKTEKALFASSMLVCKVGYIPQSYNDYKPSTVYGESKVRMEEIIKTYENMACNWIILRPTSIWGPWFDAPYRDFFDLVIKKQFVHPGNKACTKTYGYIGNSVYQIDKLLCSQNESLDGKTFYIGDIPPVNISEWADEILGELGCPPAHKVPILLFHLAALLGDLLVKLGFKFPMTSFRLKNMTTNNILNLDDLYAVVGAPPYSRQKGIRETLKWLQQ